MTPAGTADHRGRAADARPAPGRFSDREAAAFLRHVAGAESRAEAVRRGA